MNIKKETLQNTFCMMYNRAIERKEDINMKTKVFCEVSRQGVHSLYLLFEGKRYFLFSQNYRKSVQDFFTKPVPLNETMNFSKAHHDTALIKTFSKISIYGQYVEKEQGIEVYEKTKKKKAKEKLVFKKCA